MFSLCVSSRMETFSDDTAGDDFTIEDLLDFPNDDATAADAPAVEIAGSSTDSSPPAAGVPHSHGGNCSSSSSADSHFAAEFGVPLDDLAELEWLSNFVEESFSSSDELLQFGNPARPEHPIKHNQFQPEFEPARTNPSPIVSVPAKARSKRSRAAPGNWTSRLLVVSSPTPTPPPAVASSSSATSSSDSSDVVVATTKKSAKRSKKEGSDGGGGGEGRRCLHCATDKTPQWRTGPMGPKTLCNACGVRYKSGRLVPEYRPAASPTFVLTKHSNSHRKVMELRRQKELTRAQQQPQFMSQHHQHHNMMYEGSSSNGEDYLIEQHVGPDFRQLI